MPAADQGVDSERYMLIPRVLVFLERGEHVLLLKGAPNKRIWPDLYNGIGGHVERGEDVLSAARRELLEETGLSVPDLWLCGVVSVDTGQNPGICIFILRGECPEGEPRISNEGVPEWISLARLHELALVEDLYTVLPRIFLVKKGDPPLFIQYSYDPQDQLVIHFNIQEGMGYG